MDAVFPKKFRRAAGGIDGEAELFKPACDFQRLVLILIFDGDEHAALFFHFVPRGNQALEQRILKAVGDAEHLAGGFHFRPELDIHIVQLFKAEHRNLDRNVIPLRVEPRSIAHGAELLPQHAAGGKIDHRHARYLADIRHGAARTGVDFDHIDLVVINNVLDIDKAHDVQRLCKPTGVIDNGLLLFFGDGTRRVNRNGISRMHARALDMLHDTGNEEAFAVADGVYLHLGSHHVLID